MMIGWMEVSERKGTLVCVLVVVVLHKSIHCLHQALLCVASRDCSRSLFSSLFLWVPLPPSGTLGAPFRPKSKHNVQHSMYYTLHVHIRVHRYLYMILQEGCTIKFKTATNQTPANHQSRYRCNKNRIKQGT